jgi:hypothetical protein
VQHVRQAENVELTTVCSREIVLSGDCHLKVTLTGPVIAVLAIGLIAGLVAVTARMNTALSNPQPTLEYLKNLIQVSIPFSHCLRPFPRGFAYDC